jgi:hypothetical protein
VNTWASDFLDEDTDMSDPSYFFIRRQLQSQPTDADARLAALRALSDAAHKGRVEEAEREAERELHKMYMEEEYYGAQVLLNNGICPECLWPLPDCECPTADSYTSCHVCGFPQEICECEQDDDERLPFSDEREVTE